jgi:hypothetical protein
MPKAVAKLRVNPQSSQAARYFWIVIVMLAALGVGAGVFLFRARSPERRPLEGYIARSDTLQREYSRFIGKSLADSSVLRDFEQANALMLRRDLEGAAAILEKVSKTAAVPVVFNDLGVVYVEMNNRGHALTAFREALARDSSYAPVRANMDRLRGMSSDASTPVTHELEPNNSNVLANPVPMDARIDAEIAAGMNDVDSYRFTTPPKPRDIIAIELTPDSQALSLGFRLYESEMRLVESHLPPVAGGEVDFRISPDPGNTYYIQVWSGRDSAGPYSLRVHSLHAYDGWEPDEDIFNAHRLSFGQPVEANIMDGRDTDFYSFVADRTGTVQVEVKPRSVTLIPGLTTFTPDRRHSGFGPDLTTTGTTLHHVLSVEDGKTYYLQVWSRGEASGDYTIVIQ